jgi:hypothetical protein
MRYLAIVTASLAMTASMVTGQTAPTPDTVREQYPLVESMSCTDRESGERGFCFLFDAGGSLYMVFAQDGEPVFMRHVIIGQPYVEVWRTDTPLGMAL